MSPTLVYFLMMADNIKDTLGIFSIILGSATAICFFGRAVSSCDVRTSDIEGKTRDWRIWNTWDVLSRRVPWLFIIAALLNTFMPGTKTIAAMVVLPKLTSPQALNAISSEAKEMYDLAKDALRNLAGDKPAAHDTKE